MRKRITAAILLVMAIALGIAIWCYFQKDYHPVFRAEEGVTEEKSAGEPESVRGTEKEEEPEIAEELQAMEAEEGEICRLPPYNEWGVMLTAKDVSSEGMTLVCTQSGGSPTGELMTGPWYEIETLIDGQWQKAPSYAEVCWEDIAWNIPMEGSTQWEVNWTWIYDKLPAGEYRIAKEIMDFRENGDYDTCISYAYFTIE